LQNPAMHKSKELLRKRDFE
jgi:hypothetical protein